MRKEIITRSCSRCGSESLSYDAYANWNKTLGKFDFYLSDYVYCGECGEENTETETTSINQRLLTVNTI